MFDYMTAQEAAEKWEVSLRWVQRLCKENRVKGAINVNRVWLIPKKAKSLLTPEKKLLNKFLNFRTFEVAYPLNNMKGGF